MCFEQKYEKYQNFYLKIFLFLVVKFSINLNRHVFVMGVPQLRDRIISCCCLFFFYFFFLYLFSM